MLESVLVTHKGRDGDDLKSPSSISPSKHSLQKSRDPFASRSHNCLISDNQPHDHHSPLTSHACPYPTYSADHSEESFKVEHCRSPRSINGTNLIGEFHHPSHFFLRSAWSLMIIKVYHLVLAFRLSLDLTQNSPARSHSYRLVLNPQPWEFLTQTPWVWRLGLAH